ncbi:MAG: hypothetical protein HWN68_18725, partial [Desulfobacterales bacterium]|nr:hypothetical protein [Desulfobacterales bacterium]
MFSTEAAGGKAASTGAERRVFGKAGSKKGKSALAKRPAQLPKCPECGSGRAWRDGLRKTGRGDVQRWLCRDCGLRFSESTANLNVKINVSSQSLKQPNSGENLLQSDVFQGECPVEPTVENPPLERREDVAPHITSKKTIAEKHLYAFPDYNRERRICVSEVEMKNLVKVEPHLQKAGAGATLKPSEA